MLELQIKHVEDGLGDQIVTKGGNRNGDGDGEGDGDGDEDEVDGGLSGDKNRTETGLLVLSANGLNFQVCWRAVVVAVPHEN